MVFVYLIQASGTNHYKIGSTQNVEKRLKQLQTSSSLKLDLVCKFKSSWPKKLEFSLHRLFSNQQIQGEWFELDLTQVQNFENYCYTTENNFRLLESSGIKF